jgi:replicative DNA helicase
LADLDQFQMSDHTPEPPPDDSPTPLVDDRPRVESYNASVDAALPANIDAEKTILGAILLDNQAFSEAAETIVADDMSLDSHRRIFLRMSELIDAQKAVDIVTLSEELARYKEVEAIGGVAYIASLTEGLPRRPVISDYIRIVKDKAMLRRMMGVCSQAIARAADQSTDALAVLEFAEGELLQIAQDANTGRLKTIYDSVKAAGGTEPYLKAYTDPELKPGLQTGFVDLDRMTGGLQKSELTIIAARPSLGKTSLGLNIAENVCCGTDAVVAIFSLEMSRISLERRFMASRARVNVRRAMEGIYLGREERTKLETALMHLVEANIFIDDSATLTPIQLRAKARRLKTKQGRLDLILIDYLTLMSAGQKFQNREQEIASISRSLKACAKELECPVVAMAQLNRNPEQRSDKRPVLSDLRESGQIEQDADLILFLHREAFYKRDEDASPEEKALAEIIIGKSRNGPTGVVRLCFMDSITRFENLARD